MMTHDEAVYRNVESGIFFDVFAFGGCMHEFFHLYLGCFSAGVIKGYVKKTELFAQGL